MTIESVSRSSSIMTKSLTIVSSTLEPVTLSEALSLYEKVHRGSPVDLPPIYPRNRLEDLVLASIFGPQPPEYFLAAPSPCAEIPIEIRKKIRGLRIRVGCTSLIASGSGEDKRRYIEAQTTTDGNPNVSRFYQSVYSKKLANGSPEQLESTLRGHEREENILEALKTRVPEGTTVRRVLRLVNPAFPWLVCTPDGVVFKEGEAVGLVEVKTTRGNILRDSGGWMIRRGNAGWELIPGSRTWYQIQSSLAVSNLDWCLLHSENPTRGSFISFIVYRDEKAISSLLTDLYDFYVDEYLPAIVSQ